VNGYALIGIIWICIAASALALSASVASRQAVAASRNRIALARAEWLAEACLARARATIVAALREEARALIESRSPVWNRVDEILEGTPTLVDAGCLIAARAIGSRLNVNTADEATLSHLFQYAGMAPPRADSIAAAIADWRDADDIPRPLGAEREWYEALGRVPPMNRPFTHIAELAMVRGVDGTFPFDSLLDVEEGGISINHAPAALLRLLPGFTPAAAARVLRARAEGQPIKAFAELRETLSPADSGAMAQAEPELMARTSLIPQGWILTAQTRAGAPPVTATVELRIERFETKLLVLRRRSWFQ
jgi:general secretion pathway protein K